MLKMSTEGAQQNRLILMIIDSFGGVIDKLINIRNIRSYPRRKGGRGGGVLPYIGYIGMCCAKGYGFLPLLVI